MSPSNKSRPARKAAYNKPPTTFSEQVKKLVSRGLAIPDQSKAEFYLSQLNYYRFAAKQSAVCMA